MAQNVNPTFVKTPNSQVTTVTTGSGTGNNLVTLYTGGASGSKVTSCVICANTSVAQDVRVLVNSGPTANYINTVNVAATAGFASANLPVNAFSSASLPLDSDGNAFLFLPTSAFTLQITTTIASSTWVTGNTMYFAVTAGDF